MIAEQVSRFHHFYEQRHQLARDWKRREGREVFGYLYSFVPEELIYAAGILPVQLTEDEGSAVLGRTHLPDFYCNFVLSCLGQALSGTYDYLDGLVIPDACHTIRRFAGSWKLNVATPFVYYLTPPIEETEGARKYYIEELAHLKQSLEDFCGRKVGESSLRSAIEVYNENRDLLRKLYETRLQSSPPLSGSQVVEIVKAGLIMPKEEHNIMLRELLQQISSVRPEEHQDRFRLLVSIFVFEDCTSRELNIFQMLEEMGGKVVFDDLCMGARYFWAPAAPKPTPMEALVERYLAKIPVGFRHYLGSRLEVLLGRAHRYRVDGAIFVLPKYCDAYLLDYPYMEKAFKEAGIPTLMLESTDALAAQQMKVRLQAFMEMLE